MGEHSAESGACSGTCDYCRPDAWHECRLPARHDGYHSCSGYVLPPGEPGFVDGDKVLDDLNGFLATDSVPAQRPEAGQ